MLSLKRCKDPQGLKARGPRAVVKGYSGLYEPALHGRICTAVYAIPDLPQALPVMGQIGSFQTHCPTAGRGPV